MSKRTSISALESIEAMELAGDPDIKLESSNKREVNVRFRGTKAALGGAKLCVANVTDEFMNTFTTLNEILVKGNPFVEFPDPPLQDSVNKGEIAEVDNSDYRRLPAFSSSMLSAYGKDVQANKKFPEKLLNSLDPATMPVNCAVDMWLWLEVQKYFTLVTPATHDTSVLQLLDIGGSKLTKWCTPLENLEDDNKTDVEDFASIDDQKITNNSESLYFSESIEFAKNALQRLQESVENSTIDSARFINTDDFIKHLEEQLLHNNLITNMHIMNLRKRQLDSPTFWQEHDKNTRDNMMDGMTMKRYMKLNKKQKMFKRFAGEKASIVETNPST